MRWKIVSRVAKRTHEQFRVEVYLRVGVQTRRARFTPHRFVRDNLRRANERERERNKKRERKSTSEYPHRSLVRERERNRRRRRRVRIRLARTTTKQSISKINPFLSQRRIQKPNRCRADRRAPPSKTPREATAPPSQNKKAKFELFLLLLVLLLLSLFADDYCHQKRTGTSWIGFSGVTRAPNGRMHFCADWRSSGQQLNENRTPSAFSKSDHDIADAMWGVSSTTAAVSFFLEEREGSK